jgi:hypothetical protein
MRSLARWLALTTLASTTLALDAPGVSPYIKTCPHTTGTAAAGGLPAERSTVTSTVTVTRTPDIPIAGSTGICAATSGQGDAASTITITETRTYTSTSTATAYASETKSTTPVPPVASPASPTSSSHSTPPPAPPSSQSQSVSESTAHISSGLSGQNSSLAIVTAYFSDGELPSVGPLQNYTLPSSASDHAPTSASGTSVSPPASPASPSGTHAKPSPSSSGTPSPHAAGEKKPCQITVYTYADTSNCISTFNERGACDFTTYFPELVGNGYSRLAIPAEIFDSFGGVAQNNPVCGSELDRAVNTALHLAEFRNKERSPSLQLTASPVKSWLRTVMRIPLYGHLDRLWLRPWRRGKRFWTYETTNRLTMLPALRCSLVIGPYLTGMALLYPLHALRPLSRNNVPCIPMFS